MKSLHLLYAAVSAAALFTSGCLAEPIDPLRHQSGHVEHKQDHSAEIAKVLRGIHEEQRLHRTQDQTNYEHLADGIASQKEMVQAAIQAVLVKQDAPQSPFSPVKQNGFTGAKVYVTLDGSCKPCDRLVADLRVLDSEGLFSLGETPDNSFQLVHYHGDRPTPFIEYYLNGVQVDRVVGYPESTKWIGYQGDVENVTARHPRSSGWGKKQPYSSDLRSHSNVPASNGASVRLVQYGSGGGAFNGYYNSAPSYGSGGGGGGYSYYGSGYGSGGGSYSYGSGYGSGGGSYSYSAPSYYAGPQYYRGTFYPTYTAPSYYYSAPASSGWGFNMGLGFSNGGIRAGFGGSSRYCDPVTGICY